MLVIPNARLTAMLSQERSVLTGSGCILRLFTNDFQPTPASAIADFIEATFTGYASQSLGTDWTAAAIISPGVARMNTSIRTFSFTGGSGSQTIYGFYAVNTAVTSLMFSKRFASPIVLSPTNTLIEMRILYSLRDSFTVNCP